MIIETLDQMSKEEAGIEVQYCEVCEETEADCFVIEANKHMCDSCIRGRYEEAIAWKETKDYAPFNPIEFIINKDGKNNLSGVNIKLNGYWLECDVTDLAEIRAEYLAEFPDLDE